MWHVVGRNCCKLTAWRCDDSCHWPWFSDWQMSNWCTVEHLWLADWCLQWLTECWSCVQAFFVTSFFMVAAGWTVKSFCGFFAMVTKYLFVIYQMMLTSVNKYYSGTVSNDRVLLGSSLHSVLDHGDLWTILHSSAVTFGRIRGKNRLAPFFQTWCNCFC